jgi:pyruvate dehydrogenase E1 component beta subunit
MSYKQALIDANTKLASYSNVRFLGYGLEKGRALGTLKNVKNEQIIEMPVAENLMMGFAIGLALQGYVPVVFIERMDFLMNAMDAMVNHLDKIAKISNKEFFPKVIIRCVVGNIDKPLYTGITHTQDFSEEIKKMVSFPVWKLKDEGDIASLYDLSIKVSSPVMLIEYKDLV